MHQVHANFATNTPPFMSKVIEFHGAESNNYIVPLRRLKVAILKFSLMYLIDNVHAATSGIQLPLPLKPAASSNLFNYRLEEVAGFKKRLPLPLIY